MEVGKLDEDELEYELRIRGFVGLSDANEMRILLRGLLKTNYPVLNPVPYDAQNEIAICVSKARDLQVVIGNTQGDRASDHYRAADSKLCHLLGRIDRITTDDDRLRKTRTVLLKTALHFMRELEDRARNEPLNCEQKSFTETGPLVKVTRKMDGHSDCDVGCEIFVHQGVALRRKGTDHIPGTISIVQYSTGKHIEWKQTDVSFESGNNDAGWDVVDPVRKRTCSTSSTGLPQAVIKIRMCDLTSYKIKQHSLQISLKTNSEHYSFVFQCGNAESFIRVLRATLNTRKAKHARNVFTVHGERAESMPSKSFNEISLEHGSQLPVWNFVRNFHDRPYETTLQTFCKVADTMLFRQPEQRVVDEDVAELLTRSLYTEENDKSLEHGYTIIEDGEEISLMPRPPIVRLPALNEKQWQSMLDEEQKIIDPENVKNCIFNGGLESSLRHDVWKFLLNYYPWDSTFTQREQLRTQKVYEYLNMKKQWETITPGQEERFSGFRERKSLIEKDVNRTDRTSPFFAGDDNPNLKTLHNILMTYVMYNFDLGYVQGMSDLLSPILQVMLNEVDAFWCFVGLMDRVDSNFDFDQAGMKKQLSDLFHLLSIVVPDLAKYLQKHDSANMFFCFRWLLVLFKREFSYEDIMTLWEVFWTDLPCSNFHLLVCVAILDMEKDELMKEGNGFTEILKHVNELSLKLSTDAVLSRAEGIYHQLKAAGEAIPLNARRAIGLAPLPESDNSDDESFMNGGPRNGVKSEDDSDLVTVNISPDRDFTDIAPFESAIASNYY